MEQQHNVYTCSILCIAEVESQFLPEIPSSHAGDRSSPDVKCARDWKQNQLTNVTMLAYKGNEPGCLGASSHPRYQDFSDFPSVITSEDHCLTLSGLCLQIAQTSS